MVLFELREHFPDIVNYKLGQLPVMIFNNKAKEFAISIVHDVPDLLLERKRGKLLKFKHCAILLDLQNENSVLYIVSFFHVVGL